MLEGRQAQQAPQMPRGLYMHGGVGTGKTMLMDLFVYSAPPHYQARAHKPLLRRSVLGCIMQSFLLQPQGLKWGW